jgi:predicted NBD/HSP70 family sugar kinase
MILAIDIGGTKTLVVLCDNNGNIKQKIKFETPKSYGDFIKELTAAVVAIPTTYKHTVVAIPGKLDRKKGVVIMLGNLPWKNKPIRHDIQQITGTKVTIENDANMAALYATHNIKPLPHKSLYITISTGIGTGFVVDGVLDPDFLDSEGGHMLLEKDGKLITWEHIASGKSIVAKYGLKASEINDPKIWDEISKDFAIGIVNLSAVFDPDTVIIGGGVGTHFNKYKKFLNHHIKEYLPDIIDMPKVLPANNAEEAVILGCAILAKQIDDQP